MAQNKYEIGDKVWYAKSRHQEVTETCPVCFGKLEVTLILGNDDKVTLPCDYCGHGFSSPKGIVTEWRPDIRPEQLTITGIRLELSNKKNLIEYYAGCYVLDNDCIFDTLEEATTKCIELVEKEEQDRIHQTMCNIKNKQKNYSWRAGYHLKCAKRSREDAEYHDKAAVLCKSKARPKINGGE